MEHKDTSGEDVINELRALLNAIDMRMSSISIVAGDEMGEEFDEGIELINRGVTRAMNALEG